MSSAESSLWTVPSNHSRHSRRNSEPGLTVATGGTSGCQRLCGGTRWAKKDLDWSTLNSTSGMGLASLRAQGRGSLACRGLGGLALRAARGGGPETMRGSWALRSAASLARFTAERGEVTAGALYVRAAGRPQVGQPSLGPVV